MIKNLLILLIVVLPVFSYAQKVEKEEIKLKVYGFIKNDFFVDTRQTVSAREGHFLLFPKSVVHDADGVDINDGANFNFLSIQSRIGLSIVGGNILNAKVSAKLEGDFFGQLNPNINLFRLRHAYVKLNWTSTELLLGQYWVPMFITDCFPGTISFNTGVPFQPFGRSPQIRLTHKIGKLKLIAVANSQRDYVSRGPNPAAPATSLPSSNYIRNAAMPELSAQVHLKPNAKIWLGIGTSYKNIVPQIVTPQNYKTREGVGSMSSIAFAKYKAKKFTVKLQGVYGQNMADVLSIGGFAVLDSTDITKGYVTYTPINTMSAWADIHTNGKKFSVGIFGGFSKNLGASKEINGPVYGLGTTIESVYRVSPRVIYKSNNVKFALEGEYTVANYGATRDSKGVPTDITSAGNFRLLFSCFYIFSN
ncbi:MAG: hypothetical protein KAG84_04865 [Bacteroidales bacterium]|nr:hypothetical protein [Bacteroidales bacterium]